MFILKLGGSVITDKTKKCCFKQEVMDNLAKEIKKADNKKSDILNASEIAQYYFCSQSWFLQKIGHKPISPKLELGIKKHKKLGSALEPSIHVYLRKKIVISHKFLRFF